nr:hypothetical protein CFP56_07927 [Quercus suber]
MPLRDKRKQTKQTGAKKPKLVGVKEPCRPKKRNREKNPPRSLSSLGILLLLLLLIPLLGSSHLAGLHALDHDLDAALARVGGDLEGVDGVLEPEAMGDEGGEVEDAAAQQADGARPGVGVAVLELQVDLARAEAHEGQADLGLANADDEDLAAELGGVDGAGDGRLLAGALHGDGGLDAVGEPHDLGGEGLGGVVAGHLEGARAGAELLGEGEAAGVDVGDDDGLGAGGLDAGEGDEADGPGAADEDAVAEGDVGALHAGERDAERLEQRAVLEAHVADLVAPDGRMVDIAAQQAGDGRRGAELHLLAAVVLAEQAGLALVADDVGLDGDTVADLVRPDRGVLGDDDAGGLVAKDVLALDDHGADAAGMPEFGALLDVLAVWQRVGDPQIVVGVGVDADVGLGGEGLGCGGANGPHDARSGGDLCDRCKVNRGEDEGEDNEDSKEGGSSSRKRLGGGARGARGVRGK